MTPQARSRQASGRGALLLVSATREAAARLQTAGPRRDFVELAHLAGGVLVHQSTGSRGGLRGKLLGPHVRQAWAAAGRVAPGQAVFADGEHVGVPFLVACLVRRRRPSEVVMLGHYVSRRWKRALLAIATRLGSRGTLVLHSVEQQERARPWLGHRWRTRLVAYQVDADFWAGGHASQSPPLVLAVGSENRDYETLVGAVRDLGVDCLIAAGSHWARSVAGARELPANVTHLTEPLGFGALRALYARAAVVVVPLFPVPNQSGITTILEAMSMGLPVIVSATPGQRECVRGPMVTRTGAQDPEPTADRGPQVLGGEAGGRPTGLYVPPGDEQALREAIRLVLGSPELARELGAAARESVQRSFTIDRYAAALAALLLGAAPAGVLDGRAPAQVAQ